MHAYAIYVYYSPYPQAIFAAEDDATKASQASIFGENYVQPLEIPDGIFNPPAPSPSPTPAPTPTPSPTPSPSPSPTPPPKSS